MAGMTQWEVVKVVAKLYPLKPRKDDQVFLDKFYLLVCTT